MLNKEIKEVEKEIETWESVEKEMSHEHKKEEITMAMSTLYYLENKAKLQTLKEIQEKIDKKVEELQKRLINRICRPNKPVNTFENAREHEEIIKEEFKEIFGGQDEKTTK